MISTVIFSLVLIVASSGALAIGRSYYKGLTSSKTQETARSIMEEISREVQFSSRPFELSGPHGSGDNYTLCVGNVLYTYSIDKPEILTRSDRPSGDCDPNPIGQKVLSENMRLLDLSIKRDSPTAPVKITVMVAYTIGNDLLTTYSDETHYNGTPHNQAECRSGISGSNFCSIARLETLALQRIE